MHAIKKENYLRSGNPLPFPAVTELSSAEASDIASKWATALHLEWPIDSLKILRVLHGGVDFSSGHQADADGFSVKGFLERYGVNFQESLMLNWDKFRDIDKIKAKDLFDFFSELWYPAADDLEIFDDSFAWVVVIRHDGAVGIRILN